MAEVLSLVGWQKLVKVSFFLFCCFFVYQQELADTNQYLTDEYKKHNLRLEVAASAGAAKQTEFQSLYAC